MITYNDFLKKMNFPSEEEFNKIIENLPPFEKLSDDFEFDPDDNLAKLFFDYGILGDTFPYAYTAGDFNYKNKSTSILNLENLKELDRVNEILTSSGWTLNNYKECKNFFRKQFLDKRNNYERKKLLNKLNNASIDQLRECVKKLL